MVRQRMPDSVIQRVVLGSCVGALIGGGVSFAKWMMSQKALEAEDLGVEVVHIRRDPHLMEILSRFKPLSTISEQSRLLYTSLVTQCELLYGMAGATGGAQIKANRLCSAINICAQQLSKQALKSTDLSSAPLTTDVEELEGIVNNFLHNMMLT